MSSCIKVAIRCRPLFEKEKSANGLEIQGRRILLDSKAYDPDFIFAPGSTQEDVFSACKPILQSVKDGLNGTVMVYGQTGTGKTYTMLGSGDQEGVESGLAYRMISEMLEYIQAKIIDGAQCALTLSMIEIYNEKLTDMLSPNGDEEVGLIAGFPRSTHKVTLGHVSHAAEAIKRGLSWRHTASTLMNEHSSRSHVVFILDVEEYNAFTDSTEIAHLFMVDLAGSESLKKSQATGSVASEAGKINKSLLALKSVLLALSNTNESTRPGHVPYRDSKLTELLQDSIGGTARTLMIACVSLLTRDIDETKSTLMYAVKAKSIKNAANTEKEKLLVRLRSIEVENKKLRNRLQDRVNEKGGYYITKEDHERIQQIEDENEEIKKNITDLLLQHQQSEAKQHISDSRAKVLSALLEEKENSLQKFKGIYHESLKRFDHQVSSLQTLLEERVQDAKLESRKHARMTFDDLDRWRKRMLKVFDDDAGTNGELLAGADNLEARVGPAGTDSRPVPSATAVGLPPLGNAAPHDGLPQKGGRSNTGTPQRKGNSKQGTNRTAIETGLSEIENTLPDEDASECIIARSLGFGDFASRPGKVEAQGCWSHDDTHDYGIPVSSGFREEEPTEKERSILLEWDVEVERLTSRINERFRDLCVSLGKAYEEFLNSKSGIEQSRNKQWEQFRTNLLTSVTEQLETYAESERSLLRESMGADDSLKGRLHTLSSLPSPADSVLIQSIIRNACRDSVNTSVEAFPSPCLTDNSEASFQYIIESYRRHATQFSLQALQPIHNINDPILLPIRDRVSSPRAAFFSPNEPQSSFNSPNYPSSQAKENILPAKSALNGRSSPNYSAANRLSRHKRTRSSNSSLLDFRPTVNTKLDK